MSTFCGSLHSYHYNSLLMEYYMILLDVVFIEYISQEAERAFLKSGMFSIYFCILCLGLSCVHWIPV